MFIRPSMLAALVMAGCSSLQRVTAAQCIPPDITLADLTEELPRLGLRADDPLAAAIRLAVEDHAEALAVACARLKQHRDAALGITPEEADQQSRISAREESMRRWSTAQRRYNTLRARLVTARDMLDQGDAIRQARAAVDAARTQLDLALQVDPLVIRRTSQNVAMALLPVLEHAAAEATLNNLDLAEGVESLLIEDDQRRAWLDAVYRGRRHRSLPLGRCPMSRADALLALEASNVDLTDGAVALLMERFLPALHVVLGHRNHVHSALSEYAWRQGASGHRRHAAEAAVAMANADSAVALLAQDFITAVAAELDAPTADLLRHAWNNVAFAAFFRPTIVEIFADRARSSVLADTAAAIDAMLGDYRTAREPVRDALISAAGMLAGRGQAVDLASSIGAATDAEVHALQTMRNAEATAFAFDQQWLAELAALLPDGPVDLPLLPPSRPESALVPYPSPTAVPNPELHSEDDIVIDSPSPEDPTPAPAVSPPALEDD